MQGELRGKPLSRFTVEIFGNRAAGSGEGEIFLGEVATTSDAEGLGRFSLTVDASKLAAMPAKQRRGSKVQGPTALRFR